MRTSRSWPNRSVTQFLFCVQKKQRHQPTSVEWLIWHIASELNKPAVWSNCSWIQLKTSPPPRNSGCCASLAKWNYLQRSGMVGHGAAHPLVAAVLLDVGDPVLTLSHDLCSLQVEMFMDHLRTHKSSFTFTNISPQPCSSSPFMFV